MTTVGTKADAHSKLIMLLGRKSTDVFFRKIFFNIIYTLFTVFLGGIAQNGVLAQEHVAKECRIEKFTVAERFHKASMKSFEIHRAVETNLREGHEEAVTK